MDIIETPALKIDEAIDEEQVSAIEGAVAEIDSLLCNGEFQEDPTLLYFKANCFAALRKIADRDRDSAFRWQHPNLNQEILSLRRAARSQRFVELDKIRKCQILTNLGNALDTLGRPIAAIAAWDEALRIEPHFAMAAANRAYGLTHYSAALYDPGHQCIFLGEATKGFEIALAESAILDSEYPPSVQEQFKGKLSEIKTFLSSHCDLSHFDPHGFEVGSDEYSKRLNEWRLAHRLFLNPLNDLETWPVSAQDVFHLPSHRLALDQPPIYAKYFDLIKQEYVAACAFLFEGLDSAETHPVDRTLLTFENADYSVTSVQIEKYKTAFRISYSLLDKCAVFINEYFELGLNPSKVSFRRVWFKDIKARSLHENLPIDNWRLRGLYAISLDLYDEEFREVASPLASKASVVRNAAEHRFLSVHEFMTPEGEDSTVVYISETELVELAIHALSLARETIMTLSLAMHHQESYLAPESIDKLVVRVPSIPKVRE